MSILGGPYLATFDLKAYARRGAEARVAELNEELQAIHRAFPDLRDGRKGRSPDRISTSPVRRRRRKAMSAAQKRAVSARMKKYWADRRKAKNK